MKSMYGLLCGIGGVLIGLCASQLTTFVGVVGFTMGIVLLVFGSIKVNR